jgi:hypothetical protein
LQEQIKEAEAAVVVCEKNKADFIDGHAHLEDESKANHQAREEAMRNIREIDVSEKEIYSLEGSLGLTAQSPTMHL